MDGEQIRVLMWLSSFCHCSGGWHPQTCKGRVESLIKEIDTAHVFSHTTDKDLSLPDNAFDLVLDKSLIDTFACSDALGPVGVRCCSEADCSGDSMVQVSRYAHPRRIFVRSRNRLVC